MEKQRGAPVRIAFGRHVHIGYVEPLAPARDHEHVYWVRIGEALERNTERLVGQSEAVQPEQEQTGKARRHHGDFSHRRSHRASNPEF